MKSEKGSVSMYCLGRCSQDDLATTWTFRETYFRFHTPTGAVCQTLICPAPPQKHRMISRFLSGRLSNLFPHNICLPLSGKVSKSSHLAGSTFNSSHSRVIMAERWPSRRSLMRNRTLTHQRSGSPASVAAGSLSTRPNTLYNVAFRPTLLFNRRFVTHLVFFSPPFPSCGESMRIKSLTVVLTTIKSPHEQRSFIASFSGFTESWSTVGGGAVKKPIFHVFKGRGKIHCSEYFSMSINVKKSCTPAGLSQLGSRLWKVTLCDTATRGRQNSTYCGFKGIIREWIIFALTSWHW